MPENLGLFECLYAHEFLAFQAQIYGLDETTARRRTTELLEAMELTGPGKKPLNELTNGQVLKILATDPGSVKDFAAFAKQTGNELLSSSEAGGEYTFFIKKK